LLDETIDRALWEALRLQQGANLDPIAAGMHSSLLSALDTAAGEVMGGDREETLFGRITQEYERYYTPSGRERGSGDGPNLPRLRGARDTSLAEVERIANRISSLEERSVRASECQAAAAGVATELEQRRREASELEDSEGRRRVQQAAVEALTSEVRVHASDLHAAESARDARPSMRPASLPGGRNSRSCPPGCLLYPDRSSSRFRPARRRNAPFPRLRRPSPRRMRRARVLNGTCS
jgi:hypothetical protein